MKSKSRLAYIAATVIFLVVLNLIAFLLPFRRVHSFWVGYGFSMLAALLAFVVSGYAFRPGAPRSRFYNIPVAYVAWAYLAVQLVLGLIFMIASGVSIRLSILISALPLAACALGLIAFSGAPFGREVDALQDKKRALFALQDALFACADSARDASLKQSIQSLAEEIRRADPLSHEALLPVEAEIESKIQALSRAVAGGEGDPAALCADISRLLSQRSRQCLTLR